MADIETPIDISQDDAPAEDLDMEENAADVAEDVADDVDEINELPDIVPDLPARKPFLDFLRSPIVNIQVTDGENSTTLHAHEALLVKSPWFAEQCSQLSAEGPRSISLNEDIDAAGSVLEYLYNGEYFPKRLNPTLKTSALESDETVPVDDSTGLGLLRHARVYTLAQKLGLPTLQSLAHSKIHRTESNAKGEIAYARYVYQYSSPTDEKIRGPVATFWATRSHILRHQAEQEFRAMCLEFPQFGFDVLSRVLDQKEKVKGGGASQADGETKPVVQVGRKRQRQSHG